MQAGEESPALIAACAMTTALAGTDAMAGKAPKLKPQQGLVQVATAVNNYARYFDHPGFQPIHLGH